jgi:hypothetical protein
LTSTCTGFSASWPIELIRNRDNILTTISAILENRPFVFPASKYKHGSVTANRIASRAKSESVDHLFTDPQVVPNSGYRDFPRYSSRIPA